MVALGAACRARGQPTTRRYPRLVVGRGSAAKPLWRRHCAWWGRGGSRKSAVVLGNTFGQLLVNLAKLAMYRLLPLNVLSVQPGNQLGIGLLAMVVRMVAPTQVELPTRSLVVTHPPAARLMTIEFLYYLVYGSREGSDNAELGNIRTES
jgi:hypothetical protein